MEYKNMSQGMPMGSSGGLSSQVNMKTTTQMPSEVMQKMAGSPAYQLVYPEIFYKLQPYIMMVCDQLDTYGSAMPSQEMIEQMTDSIYDDVCRMYPDIAEYVRNCEKKINDPPQFEGREFGFGERPIIFGHRFRRRGLFRDLIDILLLSEFFRRRRRF